ASDARGGVGTAAGASAGGVAVAGGSGWSSGTGLGSAGTAGGTGVAGGVLAPAAPPDNFSTCPTDNWLASLMLFQRLISSIPRLCARAIWYSVSDRKSTRLNSSHVKISYAVF